MLAAVAACAASDDKALLGCLLELLGEASDPRSLQIFARYPHDEDRRYWAVRGLQRLESKDPRRLLWELARSRKRSDPRGPDWDHPPHRR